MSVTEYHLIVSFDTDDNKYCKCVIILIAFTVTLILFCVMQLFLSIPLVKNIYDRYNTKYKVLYTTFIILVG